MAEAPAIISRGNVAVPSQSNGLSGLDHDFTVLANAFLAGGLKTPADPKVT